MQFRIQKTFEIQPEEAEEVANAFIEWLDGRQNWTIEAPREDPRTYRELAHDWAYAKDVE